MTRSRSPAPFRIGFLLAILAVPLVATLAAAQRIVRPDSLWGETHEAPEGFGFGGVELLATLLVSLLLLALLAAFFLLQAWRARRRRGVRGPERDRLASELDRRGRWLARLTYAAAPLLGVSATVLAPARELLGVQVATWAVLSTAAAVLLGAAALLVDHGNRRRLSA